MRRAGYADLPLHGGRVPDWLADRMAALGGAVVEAVVWHYGRRELLCRLSDPFWFQALGCVMGMDWHSSGITTSVMGALKRSVNERSRELGVYVCGGRGRHSRRTPQELLEVAASTGLDGEALVRSSRLSAKVDNTAVQDGFQLYLHSFVLTADGDWAVVQQGMNPERRMARRYHWLSTALDSFVDTPHTAVVGENQGLILNLTHHEAEPARQAIASFPRERPDAVVGEVRRVALARRHEVLARDVSLRRLGAVLAAAHDRAVGDFAELLLSPGLGPRTLQALALVSEVIHGAPARFEDPARFSFAHGGKDGHPFPVPLKVYDRSIEVLRDALDKAKLGRTDKLNAVRQLERFVRRAESDLDPRVNWDRLLAHERARSSEWGGRVASRSKAEVQTRTPVQLPLL
jgi:hypothetical protein